MSAFARLGNMVKFQKDHVLNLAFYDNNFYWQASYFSSLIPSKDSEEVQSLTLLNLGD